MCRIEDYPYHLFWVWVVAESFKEIKCTCCPSSEMCASLPIYVGFTFCDRLKKCHATFSSPSYTSIRLGITLRPTLNTVCMEAKHCTKCYEVFRVRKKTCERKPFLNNWYLEHFFVERGLRVITNCI